MKKSLFESKFLTSLKSRKAFLIKQDAMDSLADDLQTQLESPSDDVTVEQAQLQQDLSDGNDEISASQQQTIEQIKKEDQILKNKIQQRIESANDEISDFAEQVEQFLSLLNDPQNPNSIKFAMDNATENSPLGKVKKSCATTIGKIAGDLASLAQELRSLVGSTTVDDMLK